MKSEEVRATLDTFPMLRDMPANQFQNLTAGVILEIEDIIKKEEAQDDAVSRVIKIDRQLFYYRDLLGKATEGDTGILGLRGLSKLSTRFVISQETINLIVERARGDRGNLNNELQKLETLSLTRKKITQEDIFKLTNLSEDYGIFELVDNYLAKNKIKVSKILNENNFVNDDCILILRTLLNRS